MSDKMTSSGMITRRRMIQATGAWLGASSLGLAAKGRPLHTISLFHTTDLHGHVLPTSNYSGNCDVGGLARCATQIRHWRGECPQSLTVDVGDVWQGTASSLVSGGKGMIELFKHLGYDAWVPGNHDFDWGRESFEAAMAVSACPVLTGNIEVDGKKPTDTGGAWKKAAPWIIREVGGFQIALIGLTTPGLPYWLTDETLGGITATDPAPALLRAIQEAKSAHADAIVVLGHMGCKFHDDYANPVRELLKQAPGVDIYLGGHTHQDQPSWMIHGVLTSQADHYGIHCGRIDLTFDKESRKLVDRHAFTVLMDDRFEQDPAIIHAAAPDLAKGEEQLKRHVARVEKDIPGVGRGSRLATLFCESFSAALTRAGIPVDGVFHGTFDTGDLSAGEKTVADCWELIPYENTLVTASLTIAELAEVMREDAEEKKSDRTLWPFEIAFAEGGRIASFLYKGQPVADGRVFRIAFNSYDSRSGGQRLMRLREILERPSAKRQITRIDTRGALIEHLLEVRVVK